MSAPVTERGRVAARAGTADRAVDRAATIPEQRGETAGRPVGWTELPGERKKAGQRSARRAYARRDDRLRRLLGVTSRRDPARAAAHIGRAQFVLLVMVLLAVGLVATLWFSTAATADSYRLQDARAEALALSQQAERLHREVAVLESAPELARRAAELGMVPVQDPARLVVAPDGDVGVVGEPRAAAGQARPAPARPAPAAPSVPAEGREEPEPAEPDTESEADTESDAEPDSRRLADGARDTSDGDVVAAGPGQGSTGPG